MKRGEVYWADLAPRSGSERAGRRPVIVASNDGFNQSPGWRSVIVVPVPPSEGHNLVAHRDTRLGKTRLDRAKLSKQIGLLPPDLVGNLDDGLKAALDLD